MIVVIPYCTKDWQTAVNLLDWMVELDGQKTMPECILMASHPCTQEQNDRVISGALRAFVNVSMMRQNSPDERGWPMSCNSLFVIAASEMRKWQKSWLWLEPDATPTRKGWWNEIRTALRICGKPFMGARVAEPIPHLNGVAVYPPDVYRYVNPSIFRNTEIPFDVAMGKDVMKHAVESPMFQHEWSPLGIGDRNNPARSFYTTGDLLFLRKEAVLFHRCKDSSLIGRLRENAMSLLKINRGPGVVITPKHRRQDSLVKPSVIHAYEVHGTMNDREERAYWSWANVPWIQAPFAEPYPRDSRSIGGSKTLPFIKDILTKAMEQVTKDSDIIVLTNSDTTLLPGIHDEMLLAMEKTPIWLSSRRDFMPGTTPGEQPKVDRHQHPGRDLVAFRNWWLRENWNQLPDFILGAYDWDVCMTLIGRRQCRYEMTGCWCNAMAVTITEMSESASGNVLHESHEIQCLDDKKSNAHNDAEMVKWRNSYAPGILLDWIEPRKAQVNDKPKLAVLGLVTGFPTTLPGLLESINPMLKQFNVFSFAGGNDQRSKNALQAWGATFVPDPPTLPANRYSKMSVLHNGVLDALDASGFDPDFILWVDMDVKAMTCWDGIPRLLNLFNSEWDAVSVLGIMPAEPVKAWHSGPFFMHAGREVCYFDTLAFEDSDGFRFLWTDPRNGSWYSHGDVPCGTKFKWGAPYLISGDWTPVRSAFGPATFYRASSIKGLRYDPTVKQIHHNDFHRQCRFRNKDWKHFIAHDIVFDYV